MQEQKGVLKVGLAGFEKRLLYRTKRAGRYQDTYMIRHFKQSWYYVIEIATGPRCAGRVPYTYGSSATSREAPAFL